MLPFKLSPAFQDYLWGGNNLEKLYNKKNNLKITAESWELSAHRDGVCSICGGELDGMDFSEFIKLYPRSVSAGFDKDDDFPILIKLIDADRPLSIQVHPNDEYAEKFEKSKGKTELWYILDCKPNSFIYFGFEKEISREKLKALVSEKRLTEALRKVKVKKGDVFFIEAGTVHAVGAGIIIAEIQQNSNITYRIDDFERTDSNGKKRELHIKKALDVIKPVRAAIYIPENNFHVETNLYAYKKLASCSSFTAGKLKINGSLYINNNGKSFYSYICIGGQAIISHNNTFVLNAKKGDSLFFPADCPQVNLKGNAEFIVTTI